MALGPLNFGGAGPRSLMRMDSAATSKRQEQSSHLQPREGTSLRRMYDLLMASKGIPIKVSLCRFEGRGKSTTSMVEQLQDFYGLDIRKIQSGKWVLAGEWFGKTYRDYIADRIAECDRRSA